MKPASLRTLWLLYAAFILYGGTIPFHFAGDAGLFLDRLHRLRLNPLLSPETGRRLSIPDVVQNVLLFVPFGALGVAAAGAAGRWTWRRIFWVSMLGFGLSCTVEGLQLLMRDRVASTADVMTNTTGALVGGVAARWAWLLSARRDSPAPNRRPHRCAGSAAGGRRGRRAVRDISPAIRRHAGGRSRGWATCERSFRIPGNSPDSGTRESCC